MTLPERSLISVKQRVENNLFAYGFLPLLSSLKAFEKDQNFEVCEAILQVLREVGDRFGIEYPTKYSPEAIIDMKVNFMTKFGLSGEISERNNNYYTNLIYMDLRKG